MRTNSEQVETQSVQSLYSEQQHHHSTTHVTYFITQPCKVES